MRNKIYIPTQHSPSQSKQTGAVLAMGLMILLVLTLSAISGMESTIITERMAANAQVKSETFQSAESCIQVARATTGWISETLTESFKDVEEHTWPTYPVTFSEIATTNNTTLRAFRSKAIGGEVTTDAAAFTTRLELSCTSTHPNFSNQIVTLVQGYQKLGAG